MTKDQEEKYAKQNDELDDELAAEHAKCMPEQEVAHDVKSPMPTGQWGRDPVQEAMDDIAGIVDSDEWKHGGCTPEEAQAVLDDLEAKRKGKKDNTYGRPLTMPEEWLRPDELLRPMTDEELIAADWTQDPLTKMWTKEIGGGKIPIYSRPGLPDAAKEALGINKNYTKTQLRIQYECRELGAMLISKNRKYGDSLFNPPGVFSKAGTFELINSRLDDKLSRLKQGDVMEADRAEDEEDIIGYLMLKRVYRALEGSDD